MTCESSSSMWQGARISEEKLFGIANSTLITFSSMRVSFTFTKRLVRLEPLIRMKQMLVRQHQMNRKTQLVIANLRCVSVHTTTNMCSNQSKNARHIRKAVQTKLKSSTEMQSVKEFMQS